MTGRFYRFDRVVPYTGQVGPAIVQVTGLFEVLNTGLFAVSVVDSNGRVLGSRRAQTGIYPLDPESLLLPNQQSFDCHLSAGATIFGWVIAHANLLAEERTLIERWNE